MSKRKNDSDRQNLHNEPKAQDQQLQLPNPMAPFENQAFFRISNHSHGVLEAGQVVAVRNNSENPLQIACQSGNLRMVRNLIEQHQCSRDYKDGNGLTLVHITCINGHLKLAKYLIEELHCDPHCKSKDGFTPMHAASLYGFIDIIRYLIEELHCDPSCKADIGCTPLYLASMSGHLNLAKYLIEEQRCDSNSKDNHGLTPLHVACQYGHINLIKYFVKKQYYNPNSRDNLGHAPLHIACRFGHLDVIKYLFLEIHCDLSVVNCHGRTLLHAACENGKINVVKYLADELDCDPACKDNQGLSPLHTACQGHLQTVKYLIEVCNCNPACKCNDGWTPLHIASFYGQHNIIKYLVEKQGCDPSSKDNNYGQTPVHLACLNGHLNVVEYLVEGNGCDPNAKEVIFGCTPVHFASSGGHLDLIKYLVEKQHCNPAPKSKYFDLTPLHYACQHGHLHIAKYLVEHQHCNPMCRNNVRNWTPMHAACTAGHMDMVKYLIENQHCDLTCRNTQAQAPLHIVCEKGHLHLAKYLIEKQNCDPMAMTLFRSSPLSLACSNHHLDLVVYLVRHCKCSLSRLQSTLLLSGSYVKDHTDIVLFLLASQAINMTPALKCILFQPAFKIFVVGNSSAGKSTLVKALKAHLQNESYSFTKWYKHFMDLRVTGVESHTAGIIPVEVQSPSHGMIIMYDFAGQAEYYSSHAAVCENQTISKGSLILLVYNLSKGEEECIHELQYWKSFIHNQSTDPSIIVIASHADVVLLKGKDPVEKAHKVVKLAFGEQSCYTIVIDCRREVSDGLEAVAAGITGHCDHYHKIFRVDPKVHFCKCLIQKYGHDKLACQLSDILGLLYSKEYSVLQSIDLLPKNSEDLSHQLITLSESGELLFLKNTQHLVSSWLILKKEVLLAEINGIIFAPNNFKQYQAIANSTGVVPLSSITRLFPNHNHQMLTGFLTHLEFCHEIAESEANLIGGCSMRMPTVHNSNSEIFYFFPALVRTEVPEHSKYFFKKSGYLSGWCLHEVSPHNNFLTPRFLHTLLLRLMFSYALKCEREVESIVVQRECNVWKNGIHWMSDTGVEAFVEVVDQSTAVIMIVGCLKGREVECTRYRSQLIQTILQAKKQFSRAVEMREALIHPNELKTYPLTNIKSLITFSIHRLAKVVAERKEVITSKVDTKQEMIEIDCLLHFEPFACLTFELITALFDKANANLEIPESFLHDCSRVSYSKTKQFKKMLVPSELESEYVGKIKQCHDQYSKDPMYQCLQVFITWKKITKSPTYGGLRELLDKHSIFCGRNPLVSNKKVDYIIFHVSISLFIRIFSNYIRATVSS